MKHCTSLSQYALNQVRESATHLFHIPPEFENWRGNPGYMNTKQYTTIQNSVKPFQFTNNLGAKGVEILTFELNMSNWMIQGQIQQGILDWT